MEKFIYKLKPMTCLIGGATASVLASDSLGVMSGLALFFAGSWIWMLRSHARRKDKPKFAPITHPKLGWYEIKPFAYIATGLVLPYFELHSIYLLGMLMLICAGILILILRISNRKYFI